MLGVFHTYVPMVTNYMYQKVTADESQVPYIIACNLSIEDIRILAFYTMSSFIGVYTISSWVSYHLYHRRLSSYLIISNV